MRTIAALYVASDGRYYGLEGVDPWDEQRDARLYPGPHPVVAHPPCSRWCQLAYLNQSLHGLKVGDDGGCFAAALEAVRRWGGVLEHPAYSYAWPWYGLLPPVRGCWKQDLFAGDWVTEVSQGAYGHRARKRTWLLYRGLEPPSAIDWSEPEPEAQVSGCTQNSAGSFNSRTGMSSKEAKASPIRFRDLLLSMARSAR